MRIGELVQALELGIDVVRQDQAGELGHLDRIVGAAFLLVGQAEQRQRRALFGVPDALDGGDLGRLVLQRVQAVQVARDDLQRDGDGRGDHRRAQRAVRARVGGVAQELPGRQARDQERRPSSVEASSLCVSR